MTHCYAADIFRYDLLRHWEVDYYFLMDGAFGTEPSHLLDVNRKCPELRIHKDTYKLQMAWLMGQRPGKSNILY